MNEEPMAESPPEPTGTPGPVEEARMSEVARATNILFSPGETFEDINRKPTWVVPIIIAIVFALGFGFLFQTKLATDEFIEQMIRQNIERAMEQRGGGELPEEVIQQQIDFWKKANRFWHVITVGSVFLYVLVIACIYFLILLLFQTEAKFKKVFSVVSWSWMVRSLAVNILGIITLLLRDPETIDPANPQVVVTNVAAFLSPRETSPVLYSIAGSLDIFNIWFLILLSIGFSKISKKVSVGKAAVIVFVLWILWVAITAGFAAMTGRAGR
jgi:hypothetical protein